jgi:hypothetical protein
VGGPQRRGAVEVLLRVYTNCVEGDDEVALQRIEEALR